MMTTRATTLLCLATIITLGCTTAPYNPSPALGKVVDITVLKDRPTDSKAPWGGYVVPRSQLVFGKYVPPPPAYPPMGILEYTFASVAASQVSQALLGAREQELTISLYDVVSQVIAATIKSAPHASSWRFTQDVDIRPSLVIQPYAHLLSNDDASSVNIVAYFSAKYFDSGEAPRWQSTFGFHHPDVRPLSGNNSWTSDGAAAIRDALTTSYAALFELMVNQQIDGTPMTEPQPARISGIFYHMPNSLTLDGAVLAQTPKAIVFDVQRGPMWHGVNVFQRGNVEILPPVVPDKTDNLKDRPQ